MNEEQEYEEGKPSERCYTCRFYDFDDWYPEKICYCKYSSFYGLMRDKVDTCDSWEKGD